MARFDEPLKSRCREIGYKDQMSTPRDGVVDFLLDMSDSFDLYIFTSAHPVYADAAADACGLCPHILALCSSQTETPYSMASRYVPTGCPWVLVEDTPLEHELTRYKLNCLGVTMGREKDRRLVEKKTVIVRSYQPHAGSESPEYLGTVRDEITEKLGRQWARLSAP